MDLKEIEICAKSGHFAAVKNSIESEDEFKEFFYSRDYCRAFFFVLGIWGLYDHWYLFNRIGEGYLPIHILNGSNFKGSCRIRLIRRKMR
jgi:hypothetical protein